MMKTRTISSYLTDAMLCQPIGFLSRRFDLLDGSVHVTTGHNALVEVPVMALQSGHNTFTCFLTVHKLVNTTSPQSIFNLHSDSSTQGFPSRFSLLLSGDGRLLWTMNAHEDPMASTSSSSYHETAAHLENENERRFIAIVTTESKRESILYSIRANGHAQVFTSVMDHTLPPIATAMAVDENASLRLLMPDRHKDAADVTVEHLRYYEYAVPVNDLIQSMQQQFPRK